MDIVYIRDLRIETRIGIFDWEREVKQTVSLDLDMAFDIQAAAQSDDIAHVLDYKTLSDRVIAFVAASDFYLLERLAEALATLVLTEFAVPWLRLRISKPYALPCAQDVGLLIERGHRACGVLAARGARL